MTLDSPPPSAILNAALLLLRIGVASAEIWLAFAWFAGDTAPLSLLAVHFGIVAAMVGLAWRLRKRTETSLWVDATLLFLTGPLGAIGMIWRRDRPLAAAFAAPSETSAEAERSPAGVLYASIVAGRRARRDPENRASLMQRVAGGDLASQQFAISMLSLKYRPELHPVLMAALQSPTPAVRVQAAAVFAKLRERFGAEAKRLLCTTHRPGNAPVLAAECRELARSPFMDDSVVAALLALAQRLDPGAVVGGPDQPPVIGSRPATPEQTGGNLAAIASRRPSRVRFAAFFRPARSGPERFA